jgi:hypothetical protein
MASHKGARPVSRTRTESKALCHGFVAFCVLSCAATLSVGFLFVHPTLTSSLTPVAKGDGEIAAEEHRLGTIATKSSGGQCQTMTFDNVTGRLSRGADNCDGVTYDSRAAAAPLGTMHTLNAISKSFK